MKYIITIIVSIFLFGCRDHQVDELGLAATAGDIDKVKQLVEAGANVNGYVGYEGRETPLDRAAMRGHLEIVKYLVEHNATINEKEKPGNVVYLAASLGKFDIVDYLLSKGGRLICDKPSLDLLRQKMQKVGEGELVAEMEKTWLEL